jgi:hypothetical protein
LAAIADGVSCGDAVAGQPDDFIFANDDRISVALCHGDFCVSEDILKLSRPGKPVWRHAVAFSPPTNRQPLS